MTEFASRFGRVAAFGILAGVTALSACAPAPVNRTVTSEVTTTTRPVPVPQVVTVAAPATVTTTMTEETHPLVSRRRVSRSGNTVVEETTQTGTTTTVAPVLPAVQSTTTRSTTETIAPQQRY